MAALKEKWGSKGSPESTQYEAQLMLISPKNMAKLKNVPKYVQKDVPECTKYELVAPKNVPKYVQKNVPECTKYELVAPKAVNGKWNSHKSGRQKDELKHQLLNPKKSKNPRK